MQVHALPTGLELLGPVLPLLPTAVSGELTLFAVRALASAEGGNANPSSRPGPAVEAKAAVVGASKDGPLSPPATPPSAPVDAPDSRAAAAAAPMDVDSPGVLAVHPITEAVRPITEAGRPASPRLKQDDAATLLQLLRPYRSVLGPWFTLVAARLP